MAEQNQELDRIRLSKGQLIHIFGFPFELESDIVVLGCARTLELIDDRQPSKSVVQGDPDTLYGMTIHRTGRAQNNGIKHSAAD